MGLNNLRKLSSMPIKKIDEIVDETGDGIVTLVGFEYRTVMNQKTRQPEQAPVFHIKELGGVKFWAGSSSRYRTLVAEFLDEWKTEDGVDAGLRENPQRVKLSKLIQTPKGLFRPLDFLGSVPEEENEVP
ncbi:MAG: hypothetical protein IJP68_05795 [Selenomonadaceae bacterium]|nr:hypothetical protein [Selenomonadaceae bacterium]